MTDRGTDLGMEATEPEMDQGEGGERAEFITGDEAQDMERTSMSRKRKGEWSPQPSNRKGRLCQREENDGSIY